MVGIDKNGQARERKRERFVWSQTKKCWLLPNGLFYVDAIDGIQRMGEWLMPQGRELIPYGNQFEPSAPGLYIRMAS